ncbi:MAG: hypothetical protein QF724_07750 [Planctomycetota bacterium]|nr:hypothetical protein [Planctomycetota bacterium]MDP6519052.1 hypothetical protein [Planctomycetota bacterium]MDP6838813.1 hypothetical protein [Planctomycetota bacterium]MDP6956613.1 hypothetical protein [Planctomycetota bacterium]
MSPNPLLRQSTPVVAAILCLSALALAYLPGQPPQDGGDGGTGTDSGPAPTMSGAFATADSNGSMIAVTGLDVTGASLLYLVDTESKQLAVYQATGGSRSMQGIKLVGARRIDLDLQLDGFNDQSEYTYKELEKEFASQGAPSPR